MRIIIGIIVALVVFLIANIFMAAGHAAFLGLVVGALVVVYLKPNTSRRVR